MEEAIFRLLRLESRWENKLVGIFNSYSNNFSNRNNSRTNSEYSNMKVIIWVHKDDIINNKITKYHNVCPQGSRWNDWYQIEVTQDKFAQLEDIPGLQSSVIKIEQTEKGRSHANYTYPEFVKDHYTNE
jgi:hypothetical protein